MTAALRGLCDVHDKSYWEPVHAADRYFDIQAGEPLFGLVTLLAAFGAVTGDPGKPVITPLGRWASGRICADLAAPADPQLSAGQLIAEVARFSDEEQRSHVAWGWLAERAQAEAARDILIAAETASPLLRCAAEVVELLDSGAIPAWRELVTAPVHRPACPRRAGVLDAGPGA